MKKTTVIQGSEEHAEDIKRYFESKGAKNPLDYTFNDTKTGYFINNNNEILGHMIRHFNPNETEILPYPYDDQLSTEAYIIEAIKQLQSDVKELNKRLIEKDITSLCEKKVKVNIEEQSDDIILPEWPKILEFKDKDTGGIWYLCSDGKYSKTKGDKGFYHLFDMLNDAYCVKSGDIEINKIQLENGDVFCVGDEHYHTNSEIIKKISKFYVYENNIIAVVKGEVGFKASGLVKPQQKEVARLYVDDKGHVCLDYMGNLIFYILKKTGKFHISPFYDNYEQWQADGFPTSTDSIKWTGMGGEEREYRIDEYFMLLSNNKRLLDLYVLGRYDECEDPNIKVNPVTKRIYIY